MESRRKDGAELHYLLAIPSLDRLKRMLRYLLDENEFLSPFGIRSLSKFHQDHPFSMWMGGVEHRVEYWPGESQGGLFGGNSNWRGPIWFPINYLLIEALQRYDHYYGPSLQVEFPTGSGNHKTLGQVALELARRLTHLFLPDENPQIRQSEIRKVGRARALPRVFPRGDRPRPGRQPSNRLDRPDRPLPRRRGKEPSHLSGQQSLNRRIQVGHSSHVDPAGTGTGTSDVKLGCRRKVHRSLTPILRMDESRKTLLMKLSWQGPRNRRHAGAAAGEALRRFVDCKAC